MGHSRTSLAVGTEASTGGRLTSRFSSPGGAATGELADGSILSILFGAAAVGEAGVSRVRARVRPATEEEERVISPSTASSLQSSHRTSTRSSPMVRARVLRHRGPLLSRTLRSQQWREMQGRAFSRAYGDRHAARTRNATRTYAQRHLAPLVPPVIPTESARQTTPRPYATPRLLQGIQCVRTPAFTTRIITHARCMTGLDRPASLCIPLEMQVRARGATESPYVGHTAGCVHADPRGTLTYHVHAPLWGACEGWPTWALMF